MGKSAMKLVRIEWLDSAQPIASWELLTDLPAPKAHLCCTVGHLIHDGEDAKMVALALGASGEKGEWNQAMGAMIIPTCAILKMEIISSSEPSSACPLPA